MCSIGFTGLLLSNDREMKHTDTQINGRNL
jgi:hypothetical protein